MSKADRVSGHVLLNGCEVASCMWPTSTSGIKTSSRVRALGMSRSFLVSSKNLQNEALVRAGAKQQHNEASSSSVKHIHYLYAEYTTTGRIVYCLVNYYRKDSILSSHCFSTLEYAKGTLSSITFYSFSLPLLLLHLPPSLTSPSPRAVLPALRCPKSQREDR